MKQQLIQEAQRFQKLAGIKEEKGYYTTPTSDPKTAQVHFTTDEKPSLSKNYEPLSPKSQRKDKLTPESIKKAVINALRDNKMDYEKSITIVSDKLNIDKDKLKHDFPKNDMVYIAGSIDEIVNEALTNYRNNQVEEGVGDLLKKAALGAALAFGSPEKSMAQTPQSIEKTAFDSAFSIANMDDERAGEELVLSYRDNPFTADMWSKLSDNNSKLFRNIKFIANQSIERDIQPEEIAALGRKYKATSTAAEFLDRENALNAAKRKGIDEVVNKVLATYRKKN
jgi:hypothetical protein